VSGPRAAVAGAADRPEIAALRTRVFVEEQGVPAEIEQDAADETAVHALSRDHAGRVVATGRLLLRDGAAWWQWIVIVIAIATPILGFYGALDPAPHNGDNPNWLAFYWALAVVVLAALWYGLMQIWKPERIRNAAQHAAEHRGVAPLDESVDYKPLPE